MHASKQLASTVHATGPSPCCKWTCSLHYHMSHLQNRFESILDLDLYLILSTLLQLQVAIMHISIQIIAPAAIMLLSTINTCRNASLAMMLFAWVHWMEWKPLSQPMSLLQILKNTTVSRRESSSANGGGEWSKLAWYWCRPSCLHQVLRSHITKSNWWLVVTPGGRRVLKGLRKEKGIYDRLCCGVCIK